MVENDVWGAVKSEEGVREEVTEYRRELGQGDMAGKDEVGEEEEEKEEVVEGEVWEVVREELEEEEISMECRGKAEASDESGDSEVDELDSTTQDGVEAQITGYSCEPVTESRDLVCLICLQVLCDPVQVICCGKRFCHVCINRVLSKKMPCPHCATDSYAYFRDKAAKHAIQGLEVYCINKDEGCKWKGEFCNMEKHLNINPKSGSAINGCNFVSVPCTYCGSILQRGHMSSCRHRPYICQYCYEYQSTFEDVETKHWKVCKWFEQRCEGCGKLLQRRDLEDHTQQFCIRNFEPLDSKSQQALTYGYC